MHACDDKTFTLAKWGTCCCWLCFFVFFCKEWKPRNYVSVNYWRRPFSLFSSKQLEKKCEVEYLCIPDLSTVSPVYYNLHILGESGKKVSPPVHADNWNLFMRFSICIRIHHHPMFIVHTCAVHKYLSSYWIVAWEHCINWKMAVFTGDMMCKSHSYKKSYSFLTEYGIVYFVFPEFREL